MRNIIDKSNLQILVIMHNNIKDNGITDMDTQQ